MGLPRTCWYQRAPYRKDLAPWRGGIVHAWGTDNQSDEVSMPIPVGVVEDDKTGTVHSVYVERICFASVPPGEIDRS